MVCGLRVVGCGRLGGSVSSSTHTHTETLNWRWTLPSHVLSRTEKTNHDLHTKTHILHITSSSRSNWRNADALHALVTTHTNSYTYTLKYIHNDECFYGWMVYLKLHHCLSFWCDIFEASLYNAHWAIRTQTHIVCAWNHKPHHKDKFSNVPSGNNQTMSAHSFRHTHTPSRPHIIFMMLCLRSRDERSVGVAFFAVLCPPHMVRHMYYLNVLRAARENSSALDIEIRPALNANTHQFKLRHLFRTTTTCPRISHTYTYSHTILYIWH